MADRVRILVVDDHPIVRSGITSVLATQAHLGVVSEAENGDAAVVASAAILAVRASTRVVVLTTYASDGEVLRAIEAGAAGYLHKDVPHEELFAEPTSKRTSFTSSRSSASRRGPRRPEWRARLN